jgi:hypothetical protein
MALEPIHLPIKWILDAIYPEVKQQGRETNLSAPSNAEFKNGGTIPP